VTFSVKTKDVNTDKVVINWQNFARVRLQLKFALKIRAKRANKKLCCMVNKSLANWDRSIINTQSYS